MSRRHVVLVRHGESAWNAEHRLQGQADPPLSPLGREQAAALGERGVELSLQALLGVPGRLAVADEDQVAGG